MSAFLPQKMAKEEVFVSQITKEQAKDLIDKHHYLGSKGFRCVVAYGLFVGPDMIGAAVYHGPSAPETIVGAFGLTRTDQDGFWELGRMVLEKGKNGKNYGSMLIGRSIRLLRKNYLVRALITYAESTRHYGALYQAANFTYCGLTKPKKDFYLPDGRKKERGITKGIEGIWKDRPKKHRYVLVFDKNLTLKWNISPYFKEKPNE